LKAGRPAATAASAPLQQAFPIVRRALKILADREVSPQTGLLKSTLLQLDSTFSERTYGASSFLDFAEKLSQAGLVALKHAGRSVMVELTPGFSDEDGATKPRVAHEGEEAAPIEGDETASPQSVPVFGEPRPVVPGSGEPRLDGGASPLPPLGTQED